MSKRASSPSKGRFCKSALLLLPLFLPNKSKFENFIFIYRAERIRWRRYKNLATVAYIVIGERRFFGHSNTTAKMGEDFMKKLENRGKRVAFLALLLCFALLLSLPLSAAVRREEREVLLVGGIPFGVRLFTDGILIVGYCDVTSGGKAKNPARSAGLQPGDCIMEINGHHPQGVAELSEAIHSAGGTPLTLTVRHKGEDKQVTLSPVACDKDGQWRTGLWVRDSGAGIGTVTFVRERDHAFGGLGHGICDGESGCLVPMARGSVMGAEIGGVKRGAVGAPGELKGHFAAGKTGTVLQNTDCGVFGYFGELPALPAGALPVGYKKELHDGAATLWCTLDDNVTREYGIEISDIHRSATGNKCFTVTVTDMDQLEKTGGIVQGMSGSPIVQDGRLVGAVTHVLIGDPTTGYGIFIENMLANMAEAAGK